jgi:hypothetical protein
LDDNPINPIVCSCREEEYAALQRAVDVGREVIALEDIRCVTGSPVIEMRFLRKKKKKKYCGLCCGIDNVPQALFSFSLFLILCFSSSVGCVLLCNSGDFFVCMLCSARWLHVQSCVCELKNLIARRTTQERVEYWDLRRWIRHGGADCDQWEGKGGTSWNLSLVFEHPKQYKMTVLSHPVQH